MLAALLVGVGLGRGSGNSGSVMLVVALFQASRMSRYMFCAGGTNLSRHAGSFREWTSCS